MRRFYWSFVIVVFVCLLVWLTRPTDSPMLAETEMPVHPEQPLINEDSQTVIIVGAGISGLCSALELGRAGVEVTVYDMSSVFGGHAVMSQGGLCIVDTSIHRQSGLQDSPDLAYRDFMNWGEDANAEWVRYYVDHSHQEIYEWLIQLGVRFEGVLPAPGNTVDRFHQPVGRGIGLVTPIYRECLKHRNIHFVWNHQATKLLVEHSRIAGLQLRRIRDDVMVNVRSDYVILATGGFQSNLKMVRKYWPESMTFPERILAGSGRNSVGDGHYLAERVGGRLVKMDHQWNYFTGIPDPRHRDNSHGLSAANMHGIIVNPNGNRFANLHNWAKDVMPPMLEQDRATVWWIFDESSKREFTVSGSDWTDFKKVDRLILSNPDLVSRADSISELARITGLPPENLAATIQRYNLLVEQGLDADFRRFGPDTPEYNITASPKIETAPFYAMQSWPLTRKSMGGVAIDRQCRVTDERGQPITGLYAVGELTGLAGINGKAALEGTFLGPCIVTGRAAAWSILDRSPFPKTSRIERAERCTSCHEVELLTENPRNGFWHFEQAHRVARERGLDCLQCHAELAPYREQHHQMDPQALTNTCVQCHVAQE